MVNIIEFVLGIIYGCGIGLSIYNICTKGINFYNFWLLLTSLLFFVFVIFILPKGVDKRIQFRFNNLTLTKQNKFIYLSHPYGGKTENLEKCTDYLKTIQPWIYTKERKVIISPLHICGCLYENMDYENGLNLSMEYLKICSEMWVCPGWEYSTGCKREIEYCKEHNIPIKYIGKQMIKVLEELDPIIKISEEK